MLDQGQVPAQVARVGLDDGGEVGIPLTRELVIRSLREFLRSEAATRLFRADKVLEETLPDPCPQFRKKPCLWTGVRRPQQVLLPLT